MKTIPAVRFSLVIKISCARGLVVEEYGTPDNGI